jgi:hypothetical protein
MRGLTPDSRLICQGMDPCCGGHRCWIPGDVCDGFIFAFWMRMLGVSTLWQLE